MEPQYLFSRFSQERCTAMVYAPGLLHIGGVAYFVWAYPPTLILDSRVLCHQQLNERTQQRFASLSDVVHKLEET